MTIPDAPIPSAPRPDRREEILRAAIEHFADVGYPSADVAQIAESAGCAKGTVYLYYKSKEELFSAAVEFAMSGLIAATCQGAHVDPIEGLERAVRGYLAYFDANPRFIELLMQERAVFRDRRRPTYFEYREANRERWREQFRRLIAEGRMREIPPDRAVDVIGDLLYGTIFTNYFAGRRKPLADQAGDILDVLFHGLFPGARPVLEEERGERAGPGRSSGGPDGPAGSGTNR